MLNFFWCCYCMKYRRFIHDLKQALTLEVWYCMQVIQEVIIPQNILVEIILYGINIFHQSPPDVHKLASCTTNCKREIAWEPVSLHLQPI